VDFAETLIRLRKKAGASRYRLALWTGLSETYLMRLERGERLSPSRDVVMMLAMALVRTSPAVSTDDVNELLLSAGCAHLRPRRPGESVPAASPPAGPG